MCLQRIEIGSSGSRHAETATRGRFAAVTGGWLDGMIQSLEVLKYDKVLS